DDERQDSGSHGDEPSAQEKAQEAAESREKAQEDMKELEERDEPPKDLEDWPSDKAKYMTYGGQEGDHSYAEGPEQKLGPSELRRYEDGSIEISGEKVDNPDEHRGEPIPGGPTDPNAPKGPEKSHDRAKGGDDEGGGDGGGESDDDR
ncbi:MAG: hypothetical protein QOK31_1799, partial [Solirubrobacteraceae bacterium]|nr:hypothetical protein [Solirubrobacteraceae bacterium]